MIVPVQSALGGSTLMLEAQCVKFVQKTLIVYLQGSYAVLVTLRVSIASVVNLVLADISP